MSIYPGALCVALSEQISLRGLIFYPVTQNLEGPAHKTDASYRETPTISSGNTGLAQNTKAPVHAESLGRPTGLLSFFHHALLPWGGPL